MKVALEDYSDGKRKSFQNKVSSELLGYLELALPELASNLGIRLLDNEGERKAFEDHLHKYFSTLSKDELIKELVKATTRAEISAEMAKLVKSQMNYYQAKYDDALNSRLRSHKNRVLGKAAVYKTNNDCMDACFHALSKRLKRPLEERDFPEFRFFLLEKFPKRPFEQKTRTKAEIKKLSPERQREAEIEAKNDSWPDSTLYNFFYKKISTVK